MLPDRDTLTPAYRCAAAVRRLLVRFHRDEEGGIIVMAIVLIVSMLVMGGMAVDFMRFEGERARLQSVTDRAVLAATDLNQTIAPDVLVKDFFAKAGYPTAIVGEPEVQATSGDRSVLVNSQIDMDTYFLRMVGIDELSAPAQSAAVEGTGNIEISLVLDISGSMRGWVPAERMTKMALLQRAAKNFVDDVLLPEFQDRISINLIMYSQHVAIGDDLFYALNTTPDVIYEDGTVGWSGYGTLAPSYGADGSLDATAVAGLASYTNPSRCVDFEDAEFNTLAFDVNRTYQQVEHIDMFTGYWYRSPYNYICPTGQAEQIMMVSQNATALKNAIDGLVPTATTSIHLGIKWGVSLLDPSMRPLLAGITSIDPAFRGSRPADYNPRTVKYLIVMTDGQNVAARRLRSTEYDSYEEREQLSRFNLEYWRNYVREAGSANRNYVLQGSDDNNDYDRWMQQLCTLAAEEMTVFTIAMGAGVHGTQEMQECASQPAFAFATDLSGSTGQMGIDEIFSSIARQITALRLNL